jgi:hypothetical protein
MSSEVSVRLRRARGIAASVAALGLAGALAVVVSAVALNPPENLPPDASPQQAAAMADGQVSDAEYHAQFDRYSECMIAAGYPLDAVNTSSVIITYVNSSDSVSSGEEGRCYAQEFSQIDLSWQAAHQ